MRTPQRSGSAQAWPTHRPVSKESSAKRPEHGLIESKSTEELEARLVELRAKHDPKAIPGQAG